MTARTMLKQANQQTMDVSEKKMKIVPLVWALLLWEFSMETEK